MCFRLYVRACLCICMSPFECISTHSIDSTSGKCMFPFSCKSLHNIYVVLKVFYSFWFENHNINSVANTHLHTTRFNFNVNFATMKTGTWCVILHFIYTIYGSGVYLVQDFETSIQHFDLAILYTYTYITQIMH